MFQTASLYSIEVDYYNYGTCEITKGSYFCGDHSCNTFQHVGEPAVGSTVSEHRVSDSYHEYYRGHIEDHRHWGESTDHIYTAGSGNAHGSRDSASGHILNNMPLVSDAYVSADHQGYPLRGDAVTPQYHMYDGMHLSWTYPLLVSLSSPTLRAYSRHEHHFETLVAGACKSKCDVDTTCKAFQENRWEALHTSIKCTTYHFHGWISEHPTFVDTNLISDESWDFYEKYTQAKSPTWLHAPTRTAFTPTTHAPGAGGRRLAGVY